MKVLIVTDGQVDFTTGALANPSAVDKLPMIASIIEYARANGFLIYYTKDTHDPEKYPSTQEGKNLPIPHAMKDTPGWMICNEIAPKPGEKIVIKTAFGYNGWWRIPDLHREDIEEIWFVGFVSEICVVTNFMDVKTAFPEIPIKVFNNACAGITPQRHIEAMHVMSYCQGEIVDWMGDHYEPADV